MLNAPTDYSAEPCSTPCHPYRSTIDNEAMTALNQSLEQNLSAGHTPEQILFAVVNNILSNATPLHSAPIDIYLFSAYAVDIMDDILAGRPMRPPP